jgi:hypothetical protein
MREHAMVSSRVRVAHRHGVWALLSPVLASFVDHPKVHLTTERDTLLEEGLQQ